MTALHFLTAASLSLAAAQVYLTLNRLWKRKHEVVVAESISIAGEAIGLVPLLLLSLTFALDGQWLGLADASLWTISAAVTITIGAGVWVEGRRERGFLSLVRDALRTERREVGYLARSLLRPANAEEILKILAGVAYLDDHLDARERVFLERFSEAWGLRLSWETIREMGEEQRGDMLTLQRRVAAYLTTSPPEAQVRQLGDILRALVAVDEEVSTEEEFIMAELEGMLAAYLSGNTADRPYAVALVPQDSEQDSAIASVLPGVEKTELHGGRVYLAGSYHSQDFAEVVGTRYRALGFFAVVVRLERRAVV